MPKGIPKQASCNFVHTYQSSQLMQTTPSCLSFYQAYFKHQAQGNGETRDRKESYVLTPEMISCSSVLGTLARPGCSTSMIYDNRSSNKMKNCTYFTADMGGVEGGEERGVPVRLRKPTICRLARSALRINFRERMVTGPLSAMIAVKMRVEEKTSYRECEWLDRRDGGDGEAERTGGGEWP